MKFLIPFFLTISAFAQTVVIGGIVQTPQAIFDAAYWASQPPATQVLKPTGDGSDKAPQAQALALQGFIIDVPIMVYGWDPYVVMTVRKDLGFTWVPSALQNPIPVGPGLGFPGLPSYDPTNPPKGSIKVSINIADYPPFKSPTPVTPLPSNNKLIGFHAIGTLYGSTQAGFAIPDGAVIQEDGLTCTKHIVMGLMGRSDTFDCL